MNTRMKRGVLHLSLLCLGMLFTLPVALPANENETPTVNSTISSNKKLADFFRYGAAKTEITFSEVMDEYAKCNPCFKELCDKAHKTVYAVQTADLIAITIENCNHLPLDVQDAINSMANKAGDTKLRTSLEILINEAKALELLENQLSDNSKMRLPWRVLCERVAILLKDNAGYTDFAKALLAAKDAYCVLFAKIRLKEHLKKLPKRVANVAKDVERRCPGDVVPRIFYEG